MSDTRTTSDTARRSAPTGSAWRNPETDPPTLTGKILVWIHHVGPAIVTVEEGYMAYWDGEDETESTSPEDWDLWTEINQPNEQS